jgi:protease-4
MLSLGALTGCKAPSFLITPVAEPRELEEIELAKDSLSAFDKIALIDVTGTIRNASPVELFVPAENPVSMLLEQLDMARRDSRVKAIILRINSPGGSVVASELMHDEITHFRKESDKPIVALMMDVAASGGYYIACACDQIVAQTYTVTGSIGVIMMMFNVTGTMQKVGLSVEAITSGEFKDAGSPFKALSPEDRAIFAGIVLEMYERFVEVVAAGRPGLTKEQVRSLADGRVYSAKQALDAGLIDAIASPRETIEQIKEHIGARNVKLVTYARPYEYRPNYYAKTPAAPAGDVNLLKINLPSSFAPAAPEFMYLWSPGQ